MFAYPTYLHIYDNESNNDKADEDHSKESWVVDMCKLMTIGDTSPIVKEKRVHNQPSSSFTPTKKPFV
jgi:hypothetical protein